MPPDEPTAADALSRLPPERRQHKDEGIVLYACCCCCCCCCLHTVGGVIGAAMAGNYRGKAPRDPDDEFDEFDYDDDDYTDTSYYRRSRDGDRLLPGIQGLFWTSVLIVILLQVVIGGIIGVINGAKIEQALLVTPCALLMLGPLYFVVACVVLLIRIALTPSLRRDGGYFGATLRIFGGTIAGTIAGTLLMVGPLLLFQAFK